MATFTGTLRVGAVPGGHIVRTGMSSLQEEKGTVQKDVINMPVDEAWTGTATVAHGKKDPNTIITGRGLLIIRSGELVPEQLLTHHLLRAHILFMLETRAR